jgi:two-component system, OmpR family, sensor histidine kinase KdpD
MTPVLSDQLGNTFVQSVSHYLRAPLAGIQMTAAFLREKVVGVETRNEMLADIESRAGRLLHLVSDLLDLSRLDAGILEPRRRHIPAEDLVYGALQATWLGGDVERVVVQVSPDAPLVDVDETLVRQALVNVLHNAVRFAGSGPITVAIEPAGRFCLVSVSDRGPGIPRSRRAKLFQPASRSHANGAGLGLAIALRFIQANEGSIGVKTTPGGGATFLIRLPAVRPRRGGRTQPIKAFADARRRHPRESPSMDATRRQSP